MARLLLIGLGGFAGSILRYGLSGAAHRAMPLTSFPVGTLIVNISGCFAIGVISYLADTRGFLSPDARALVLIGLLGGFTTFSTFANETMAAVRDGAFLPAALNVLLSVGACLLAVWVGRATSALVWR